MCQDEDVEIIIIIAVLVPVLVGLVLAILLDRPQKPKTPYLTDRDADDLDPGSDVGPATIADSDGAVLPVDHAPLTTPTDELVADHHPAPVEEAPVVEEEPAAPAVESPAPVAGRLARLRSRLAKSNNVFSQGLLALLSSDSIDDDVWDEVEESLLVADLGTEPTLELVDRLRERVTVEGTKDPEAVRAMLREELIKIVDPGLDRRLTATPTDGIPAVMMVVGVNGVGKTTTVGKIARVLVAEQREVVLGAADTFRAAAAEQLATWGARVGVDTVRSDVEQADPASVAFEAVKTGIERETDVVLIDTAGRLQNKANLMDELGKIKRVVEKQAPVGEVLLVLDATTGQNGLSQAKVFAEAVNITGIVLTKLDGTAKGGIVVPIQRQLGVPVKLIGLGEGADDLAPFEVEAFVDALLSE
ncbi:signal recognition particle-docking protein FtsY [Citricoccus muralis]|uniref:Signal recognition particle receptor FtsY n=1 Tax=Citricoccus muralis TaxID=169134 RepID=A0ABY8HAY4_9MICC|nr:signal recognition particle-docking protein FtsY [Citricoccus muralis]WFP17772.1 signal recognition particle-docking protein FtsY [Citricoccus muralis]